MILRLANQTVLVRWPIAFRVCIEMAGQPLSWIHGCLWVHSGLQQMHAWFGNPGSGITEGVDTLDFEAFHEVSWGVESEVSSAMTRI